MAQPKKKTTTKTAKVATPKKTTKIVARKNKTAQAEYQTLRLNKADKPFMSAALTNQTAYWLVIAVLVLALGAWIVHLQVKINGIYDTIDTNQQYYDQMQDLELRVLENKKAIESNKTRLDTAQQ